jgi:hypothetical protein
MAMLTWPRCTFAPRHAQGLPGRAAGSVPRCGESGRTGTVISTQPGGTVVRPCTVTSLSQDAAGVSATLADGGHPHASFLVGADGIHSTVRDQAGIGFTASASGLSRSAHERRHRRRPWRLEQPWTRPSSASQPTRLAACSAARRPVAQQIVTITNRLTSLATMDRQAPKLRTPVPAAIHPVASRRLAWRSRCPPTADA